MKNFLSIFIIILLSCSSKTEEKKNVENQSNIEESFQYTEPKITGEKYFDYDEIIYFKNDYDGSKIGDLFDNKKKSDLDSLKFGVILDRIPKSINDLGFMDKLENIGYKKSNLDKSKFESIDKIFIEKKHSEVLESACVYVYRDILIFKKKSKIVGIAKICFECGDSEIFGTKSNTDEFGQSGDYEALEEILNIK